MTTPLSHQPPLPHLPPPPLLTEALQKNTEPASTAETSEPDTRQALNTALADHRDLQTLAKVLATTVAALPENAEPSAVSTALQENRMPVDPTSSFQRDQRFLQQTASLEAFIKDRDFTVPLTVADLKELAETVAEDAISHPLGNFAGALSWPVPLSVDDQREVFNVVACNSAGLEGLPLEKPQWGALDYLVGALKLSASDLQDPINALEKLLDSPQAQALGAAIQRKVKGIATSSSVNDYVLTAIHLGLDPDAIEQPIRNHVAGFDLASDAYWGKPPSAVVSALASHLIARGRTSKDTAELAAHLLLARVAPQFLLKDIPAGVDVGTTAWANLCLAVARIEAEEPGKAAMMSFAQVMQLADGKPPASGSAQKGVLIDWAIANQVLDKRADGFYPDQQIETARNAFNKQQSALKAASELLEKPMPDRKAMALALLKKHFGEGVDFEHKGLRINYGPETKGNRFSDPYSMLDITMQGLKLDEDWHVMPGSKIDLKAFAALTRSAEFNVPRAFDEAFTQVTRHYKDIKQNLVMNAITHLPAEDRHRLNYGELKFFKENTYRRSAFPFVPDSLFHSSKTILVQAEYEGKKYAYAFDTVRGTAREVSTRPTDRQPQDAPNEIIKFDEFFPDDNSHALKENRTFYRRPNVFDNPRIQQVATTVVKGLEIDGAAVKRLAAGRTTAEQRADTLASVGEFLLDLIPLRSAIVNWRDGKYKDAATDLALDIFGLVTAGVGAAAKVVKTVGKAGSALTKMLHGSRIIGAAAIGAFNPLDGTGDLLVGAGKLAVKGSSALGASVQKLRGIATASDLAEASKRFDSAATGTFKVGSHSVEGSAVMRDGHWYAYDAHTQAPYGTPLADFNPEHTLMPPYPPQGPVKVQHNARAHPYARPGQPLRQTHVNTNTAANIVKTDHLDTVNGEYVKHIKGAPTEAHFTPSRKQATKERFEKDMNAFYEKMDPMNPTNRPELPEVGPFDAVPAVIEKALDRADVVIFGENHRSLASFRTLYDNVDVLKRKNVKVIGIEGMVYDNHKRLKDDGMGWTGNGNRPAAADIDLNKLLQKLKDNGIEAVPLDHWYLTRHRHDRAAYTGQSQAQRNLERLKEFNYYATRELEQHKHKGKVIALVGSQHTNTTQGVTGLAESTGGIGIGIFERAGLRVPYGTKSMDPKPGPMDTVTGHNDLTGDLQIFTREDP
jgi:hypothetical protein